MKRKHIIITVIVCIGLYAAYYSSKKFNFNPNRTVGEKVDSLHGVMVYYNGGVNHVEKRNLTKDGYNLGLEYQCVEFVKRYYYERFNHKMPDAYGHAKDFFDKGQEDGTLNSKRGLLQYKNPNKEKPQEEDLLVMGPSIFNRYGHVAIISKVTDDEVEIIQQNPGPFSTSRETFPLVNIDGRWEIVNERILGWLRKQDVDLYK